MSLTQWAIPQLQKLLPLDEESLVQIIEYSDSLPKPAAAEHLKNLLGDSASALEFIASFNQQRPSSNTGSTLKSVIQNSQSATASGDETKNESESEVPRGGRRPRKKKAPLNRYAQPQRQPDFYGDTSGGYVKKKEQDDYVRAAGDGGSGGRKTDSGLSKTLTLQETPNMTSKPRTRGASPGTSVPKLPPSAAGPLISDSQKSSRSSSPAGKMQTKVKVAGGTPMHGQSATLNDLDSAIRALEIQTNPSLGGPGEAEAKRRCNCMAQRHALLEAAPNCLTCGKIVCVREGIGPCTFCGKPLLSSDELQVMVQILREERGKERQQLNNTAHKRAEVSKVLRPFASPPALSSAPSSDSEAEKLNAAKQHRDRLLKFQTENVRRTQIHDEAADFETPDAGQSIWATPQERALQLKRQQKVLREQEWNARPEWEKRRMVASIDIVGGKAVRKMVPVSRALESETETDEDSNSPPVTSQGEQRGGSFSRNPLLGQLIRPVFTPKEDKGKGKGRERPSAWRRVQDDNEDNEQWILDGGAYGDNEGERILGAEERAQG